MILRRLRRRTSLTAQQRDDMIDLLSEATIASHGTLEYLQRRGRGILESARRSRHIRPPANPLDTAAVRLRCEAYEAIGLLITSIEHADDPHHLNQVGAEVRIIAQRMEAFPREPDPPPPSGDISVQLRRINGAVDAEADMIYRLQDTGNPVAAAYFRHRGLHLLELGMIETEQAGMDVTTIRAAISATFNIPDPHR
ncbi:hypothetical protein ABZ863_11190 [Saccharomonospora sp. NPDC046836]|uniref:hypothetical protein n=1 Tax=Saccharomonospora sp. NPDC046836 TaxID=3156921 RepID=UPI003400EA5B